MATKRIKDITNTGSEDDLKSENFFALDGPNGSKKIPGDAFTPSGRTDSISSSIAPEFDPDRAETYPAGSLVMHEGELREFTADHPTGPWISGDNRKAVLALLIGGSGAEIEAGVNVLVETLGGVVTISVPSTDLAIDTESMGAQVENNTIILSARSAFKSKTLLFENTAIYPNNLYEFLQTYPLSESLNNYDYVMFEYVGNADTSRTGVVEVALFKIVPGPMAVVLHGYHINENVTPITTWENLAFLKSNSSNTSFSYAEETKFRKIDDTSWSSPQDRFTVNKIWGLK